jgi:hypothetical protein
MPYIPDDDSNPLGGRSLHTCRRRYSGKARLGDELSSPGDTQLTRFTSGKVGTMNFFQRLLAHLPVGTQTRTLLTKRGAKPSFVYSVSTGTATSRLTRAQSQ